MFAVHAQAAHELIVFGHDDRVLVRRLHRLRRDAVVVEQLVLLRTGAFALFAADAHGRVIQQGFAHKLLLATSRRKFRSRHVKLKAKLRSDGANSGTAWKSSTDP